MNRPVILRLLAAAALFVIAAIGWPLMRKNPPASPSPSPAATSGHSRPGPTSSGTARHQPDPDAAHRKKQLADLIRRWNLLPANPGETVTAEQRALIEEAAATLLCSREFMEFTRFLDFPNNPKLWYCHNDALAALAKSDRAADLRASLVIHRKTVTEAGRGLFGQWIEIAAGACPREEIGEFATALGEERDLQLHAMVSHHVATATENPQRALMDIFREYQSRYQPADFCPIPSQPATSHVIRLLPADADFATIEATIPSRDNTRNPNWSESIDRLRTSVLGRWAKSDPAAAANYIMDHPDRIPPKHIVGIAGPLCDADQKTAIQWIQTFPEGPYYDHVLTGILSRISQMDPDTATTLVEKMHDPAMRQEGHALIKSYRNHQPAR